MRTLLELVGACVVVYFGIRIGATALDIFGRWRRYRAGDSDAWKTSEEKQLMPPLEVSSNPYIVDKEGRP